LPVLDIAAHAAHLGAQFNKARHGRFDISDATPAPWRPRLKLLDGTR
jgi:hypothetical protein